MVVKTTSPAMRRALARNLRSHLLRLEWSENELARRSGVSQKHINNMTNQRTTSSVEVVDAIARAIRLPPWMLLVEGFDDLAEDQARQLSEIVASWLGADDTARGRIASAARRAV
jgi:transcriptional regulator with XRE-family HTH domain